MPEIRAKSIQHGGHNGITRRFLQESVCFDIALERSHARGLLRQAQPLGAA
jgi:hypothetical protein